jgi:hypothetical protein
MSLTINPNLPSLARPEDTIQKMPIIEAIKKYGVKALRANPNYSRETFRRKLADYLVTHRTRKSCELIIKNLGELLEYEVIDKQTHLFLAHRYYEVAGLWLRTLPLFSFEVVLQ